MEEKENIVEFGPGLVTVEGEVYAVGHVQVGGAWATLSWVRPAHCAGDAFEALSSGELWQTDRVLRGLYVWLSTGVTIAPLTFADVLEMAQRGEPGPGVATITAVVKHREPRVDDIVITDLGAYLIVESVDTHFGDVIARRIEVSDTAVTVGDLARIEATGATVTITGTWTGDTTGDVYATARYREPTP